MSDSYIWAATFVMRWADFIPMLCQFEKYSELRQYDINNQNELIDKFFESEYGKEFKKIVVGTPCEKTASASAFKNIFANLYYMGDKIQNWDINFAERLEYIKTIKDGIDYRDRQEKYKLIANDFLKSN